MKLNKMKPIGIKYLFVPIIDSTASQQNKNLQTKIEILNLLFVITEKLTNCLYHV